MQVLDKYNAGKLYLIEYKGQHYVIKQFIKGYPVSNKLRLGIARISEITGLSKEQIRQKLRRERCE